MHRAPSGGTSGLLRDRLRAVARPASSRGAAAALAVAATLVGLAPAPAQGQLRKDRTLRVSPPPAGLVAPGDAVAVQLDPADLAFLEAWSLTYVHADTASGDALGERGDAVFFGAPLPFGLGIGAALHSVRPSQADGRPERAALSVSLAGAPSSTFGVGGSLHVFWSGDPRVDGTATLDLTSTLRPSPHLGFALLARDVNGLFATSDDLPASFLLSSALRPYGTDALTVEAGAAVDTEGRFGVRGLFEVAIPRVGRAHVVAEVDDVAGAGPDLRVVGGVRLDWGQVSAGGGVIAGDGFDGAPGYYVTAHLSGATRAGLPRPRYLADVQVRGELDARRLLSVVERLDAAAHDDRVAGVVLRLRSTDAGLAAAQELRLAIEALEESGKPVLCHLAAASGSELYACGAATRRLVDPAGGVRLTGPALNVLLLGGLLDRVGIGADFVRIGRYKSAVEQFENRQPTGPAVEQREALLDDVYERLVADLARDYGQTRAQARELVDEGPYAAPEAIAAGLVHERADARDLEPHLADAFGTSYRLRESAPTEARGSFGVAPRVGVVVVDGSIVDGDNVDVPILDFHFSGGRTVSRAIDRLAADRSVAAIVLRVDSPGGSALASDQIWRAVRRARERKPVIASMGSVAASGGYYVAAAADEIWANPATVTGSIGIFFGKLDAVELARRLDVTTMQLGRGRRAGMGSLYRPYTPDERAMLADKIRHWYGLFLERVAEGRPLSVSEVDAVGRGRIWSGDAALRHGLVDRLGGFASALARARELGGLSPDAPAVMVPSRPSGLIDYVLGSSGVSADDAPIGGERAPALRWPAPLRAAARFGATLGHGSDGIPMALLPAHIEIR